MATKSSQVNIPHIGKEFVACIKSLEDLMKEAVRQGLASDEKKVLAVWHDGEGNEVRINNEKSFQTYLKMPQKKITIRRDEEDALKIIFELKGRKHVYSFANTYCALLEDLDGSFDIRFPNDEYRIFWLDSEGDSFEVTNEKSFELFLKYGSRQLQVSGISTAISTRHDEPMKVVLTKQTLVRKQYIDCVMDWNALIKELELTFGMKFTNQEYRLFWKDDENDELEITDDSTFHIFLEKSKTHRIFIVEKPKPPTVKVYFMRLGERNHKVYYWSVGNLSHFLAMTRTNLSIDPSHYKIFDADDDIIDSDDDFVGLLNKTTEKKKIFIEPSDEEGFPLAIKSR